MPQTLHPFRSQGFRQLAGARASYLQILLPRQCGRHHGAENTVLLFQVEEQRRNQAAIRVEERLDDITMSQRS